MEPKTRAEIDLDILAENAGAIRRRVFPAAVIPVIKADAYGHGAVRAAKRLAREGFEMVAVARFEEAMELRDSGFPHPILIFGRLFPEEIPLAVAARFRITLFGTEDVRWVEASGEKEKAVVHVKVDTGMGRAGVLLDREPDFFDVLAASRIRWEGLYSHFSTSDEEDKSYASIQLSRFRDILARVTARHGKPPLVHMANSGAVLDLPGSYFDAVRPGIILYGNYPSEAVSRNLPLRQVMSLKTCVAHVRRLSEGCPVSYGRRWVTPRETTVAVLPIGYADGLSRRFTNCGEVLIRGKRRPIVGRVTMDQTMIDMGDDPVEAGDEVLVWGESAQGAIQALEAASGIDAIPYELTCGVSKRVRRSYLEK
jgi:alanine racemase